MTTTTDTTVTVYDIESNAVLYRIPATEARHDLDMHRDCSATVTEYDTTDRTGAPLHIALTVDAPRRRCTPDQGAVYEFPGTPTPSASPAHHVGPMTDRALTPNTPDHATNTAALPTVWILTDGELYQGGGDIKGVYATKDLATNDFLKAVLKIPSAIEKTWTDDNGAMHAEGRSDFVSLEPHTVTFHTEPT